MNSENKKPSWMNNPSWNLYIDKVYSYAYKTQVFSKEQCEEIIKIANTKGLSQGLINKDKNSKYRNSEISWLYPSDNLQWAFQKVTDTVLELNDKYFQFDIFGLNEGFQFTKYKSPGGHYNKHVDRALNTSVRKLSITIQLTDPKEYEGGELWIYENQNGLVMEKEQGTLTIFPSFILHKVTPVTKGERNSLVSWVTGKQFK